MDSRAPSDSSLGRSTEAAVAARGLGRRRRPASGARARAACESASAERLRAALDGLDEASRSCAGPRASWTAAVASTKAAAGAWAGAKALSAMSAAAHGIVAEPQGGARPLIPAMRRIVRLCSWF